MVGTGLISGNYINYQVDGRYKVYLESELTLTNYFQFQHTFIPAMVKIPFPCTITGRQVHRHLKMLYQYIVPSCLSHRPYSHKLLTINNYVNCPSNFAFACSIYLFHPPIFEKIFVRIRSINTLITISVSGVLPVFKVEKPVAMVIGYIPSVAKCVQQCIITLVLLHTVYIGLPLAYLTVSLYNNYALTNRHVDTCSE